LAFAAGRRTGLASAERAAKAFLQAAQEPLIAQRTPRPKVTPKRRNPLVPVAPSSQRTQADLGRQGIGVACPEPLSSFNATTKLTGGNAAQRNCRPVERLVGCRASLD